MNVEKDDAPVFSDAYHMFSEIKNENWIKWENEQSSAYKKYREDWEFYPKNLLVPDRPLHLDIESTSRCNLKCPFCARTVRVENKTWRPIRDLSWDLFKKIVDDAIQNRVYALNLNILGEPLLNKKLPEFVRYAKDVGILDVFFHTNAVLLNEKRREQIIESRLDKLIISFDSPYKEKYENVRVGAKYDAVLANIKEFSDLKKRLQVIRPLTRLNFIKLPDMIESEVDDLVKLFSPLVDSIGLLEYVDPHKHVHSTFEETYVSKFACPQLFTRLVIYEDGRTFPCCMDYDDELQLGDINNQSINELWRSRKLQELRDLHLTGKFHTIAACAKCDFAIKGDAQLHANLSDTIHKLKILS
jgi:radical SAM protein with 4Fe4S-binding SPASM domain